MRTRKSQDEYIDYSCSTPLERLSRDVETLLRSWHIVEGSDRHVSFHNQQQVFCSGGSNNHHSSQKKKFIVNRDKESQKLSDSKDTKSNNSSNNIQLIRSDKVFLTTTSLQSSSDGYNDKIEIELELCLWDGPPSSNSFSKNESTEILESKIADTSSYNKKKDKSQIPLSLQSNRQDRLFINCNLLSNLSHLLGIGQHITLSPTSQSTIDSCLQSTINALLSAQQPSRWDKSNTSILSSSSRTVEQELALSSTALNSLSSQLQMALNTATAACDCRIPAFGIWGLYKSSVLETENKHHDTDLESFMVSQSIMDVPSWMNTGDLFNIATESTPIGAFLRYLESIRNEGDSGGTSKDDDKSGMKSYSNTRSPSRSPLRTSRPNMILSPPGKATSQSNNRSNQYGQQLYLPPLINGNCHPGSSLFGTGATFAIHVVPPGVDYPIHCTTLNSLGQLLLQHCQLASSKELKRSKSRSKRVSFEDNSTHGDKIGVVAARHKYIWSNVFQHNEDYIPRQDELLLSSPSSFRYRDSWYNFNILTFGLSWRKSCEMDVSEFHRVPTNSSLEEEYEDTFSPLLLYRRKCREYAMKLLYRASCIAKSSKSRKTCVLKQSLEPLWGPTSDPVSMVTAVVTWDGSCNTSPESNTMKEKVDSDPLLTLPLRIRSQNTMSSQDILEMENTLLSTVFNPVSVLRSKFVVNISLDPDAACTTLSANNRCLLAALIRVCTLESDTLIAHITKSNILEELHDRHELDFFAEEIMDKASLSPVTRKLVEVMDWGSMADMIDSEAWSDEERFQVIIDQVLQSTEYPSPPESVFDPMQVISDAYNLESATQSTLHKGSPHGRLLSILCSSMASLQTPSAMAVLWLSFVSALRLRWEQKERLNNLQHVPGIDDMLPSGKTHAHTKKGGRNIGLGSQAIDAAFANSTEPDPNLSECLISQKLHVFNIGVEAMIATETNAMEKGDIIDNATLPLPQSSEGDHYKKSDDDSSDFRSCGTPEDISYDLDEEDSESIQIQTRQGARCPVQGYTLTSSGEQMHAPYLQREMPLTDDLITQRRKMITDSDSNSIDNRIEFIQRLQKPKLVSDMSAFRAANPGAVFQDFMSWYGEPENSLEIYGDDTDLLNDSEVSTALKKMSLFWKECWNESKPTPADKQKPLFDAYSAVEMLLDTFESMHPSALLNQVLAVNLSSANFFLKASAPSCRIAVIDEALERMEKHINDALMLLHKDASSGFKMSSKDIGKSNTFQFITPETASACESACAYIGDVEILLSRATSLLSKFSGDVDLVEKYLNNSTDNQGIEVCIYTSRSGILKSVLSQQLNNSGRKAERSKEMPAPSVREYILHNRDAKRPCQLTVCIGGTHGLETGGTNSTRGGLVLAMNKCVKGTQ